MFRISAALEMGYQPGVYLLFSLLLAHATSVEKRLILDVNKFNSSMLQMSCRSEGEKTSVFFRILKDRYLCLNTEHSICKLFHQNKDNCQIDCIEKKMKDPKILSFLVKLNGSCEVRHTITCLDLERQLESAFFVLTATSDPPVISINNGHQIEAGLDPVPIECTVANQCHQTQIDIFGQAGLHIETPLKITHVKHGRRFNTTAKTKAVFLSAGNYNITCKEKGKKDHYSTRLSVDVYDKGSKVIHGVTIIEIFFKSITGMKLVTISYSLELSGELQPSPGPNGTNVLEFRKKGQFLTLTGKPNSCLSDILLCDKGITLSTEIQFYYWEENGVFIDSGGDNPNSYGLVVKYTLSAFVFSVSTKTNVWTVKVPVTEVSHDQWMKMDISWKADIGLKIFFNDSIVGFTAESVTRNLTVTTFLKTTGWTFGKMSEEATFSMQKIVFYLNGDTEVLERAGLLHIRELAELTRPETTSDGSYTVGIVSAVLTFVILILIACLAMMFIRQRGNRNNTEDVERFSDDSGRPLLPDGATSVESSDRGSSQTSLGEDPNIRYQKIEEMIRKWNYTNIIHKLSEGDISYPEKGRSVIYKLFESFQGASGLDEDLFLKLVKKLTPSYRKSALSKKEDLFEIIWKQVKPVSIDGESTERNCIEQLKVFLPLADSLSSQLLERCIYHSNEWDINAYFVKVLTFLIKEGADPFQYRWRRNLVPLNYFVENFGQKLDNVLMPSDTNSTFLEEVFKKLDISKAGKSTVNVIIKLFSSKSFQGDYIYSSSIMELIVRYCLEIIKTYPDFCGHADFKGRTPLHNIMEKLFLNGLWKRMPEFAAGRNNLWDLTSQLVSEKNVNIKDKENVTPYSWILMWQESVKFLDVSDKQNTTRMEHIKKQFQEKKADEMDAAQGVGICRYRRIEGKIQHLMKSNLEQQTNDIMELLEEGGVAYPKEGHYVIKKLIDETKHFYQDPSFTKLVQGLYSSYQRNTLASAGDMFDDIWELFVSLWIDHQSTTDNCIAKLKIFLPLNASFNTRLLWRFVVHYEKSKKKLIRNSHFVRVLEFLVANGADPFSPNRGTTAFTLILEESAFYLQETTLQSAVDSFCHTSMKWAASQTNDSIMNDVIKSVPNVILEENSSYIHSVKEIIVKNCLGIVDQNPSLRDHVDNRGKTPLHNLMEKLLTNDAWQDMSKLTEGTDSLWEIMSELITTTNVNIKDKNNVTPFSWLSFWMESLLNVPDTRNLSRKIDHISELMMKYANARDALQGLTYIREKQKKKNVLRLKNSFCGIGKENNIVDKISIFIKRGENPRKVHNAEIETLSHLQEHPIYIGYFAVISSKSLNNHNFCLYLMSVLRRLAFFSPNNKSTFVLVVVDEDAVSLLENTQDKTIHWPIDLQAIPRVDVHSQMDDEILNRILSKLQGPPLNPGVSTSVGNVGIGLAWAIFQYDFAFMLPGITERIAKSEAYKKYAGKMSKHFIFIIPESYEIALEIRKRGIPRSKRIGLLDGGIKIKRDGWLPHYVEEVVDEITNSQGNCYYCCYKWTDVNFTLKYMLKSGELTEDEVKKQYSLYTDTMKSILRDPIYHNTALVFNCKDYSTLPDDLCDLIIKQNKQPPLRIDTNPRNQVARVAEGLAWDYYRYYVNKVAPGFEKAMKDTKFHHQKEMPAKYFILMPYSCVIYTNLDDAEKERIKFTKMLKWNTCACYIYKISNDLETYYACADYCDRLQVLHEMETGEIAALTPVQRTAELRIFYEVLNYLFTRPSAPEECHCVKLIYYDDDKHTGRKLSEIMVDEIKESLREEQDGGS